MKRLFLMLTFAISSLLCFGEGNPEGFVSLPQFNKIKVNASVSIKMIYGDDFSIMVASDDDEVTKTITYEVTKEGTLLIKTNENDNDNRSNIKIVLVMPIETIPDIKAGNGYEMLAMH